MYVATAPSFCEAPSPDLCDCPSAAFGAEVPGVGAGGSGCGLARDKTCVHDTLCSRWMRWSGTALSVLHVIHTQKWLESSCSSVRLAARR